MPSRKEVVEEALTWVGTRWQHQGRSRQGIDCAGLVIAIAQKFEFIPPGYKNTNYQRRPNAHDFLQAFRDTMDRKPILDAKPGDVLLFKDGAYPCHSAIVGNRGDQLTIIHSHAMQRKVLEELLDQGQWLKKRVACFEFRGIE